MEIKILNKEGKATTKKVTLTKGIFDIEPNDHAIYLDVKQYLANQRQGTHQSRERGEIAGSTRKIKKQKGTGTARAGSIKNPLFRGGGRVFGPRPKSYSFKLNKKLKVLARKSALSYKAKDKNIMILEEEKNEPLFTQRSHIFTHCYIYLYLSSLLLIQQTLDETVPVGDSALQCFLQCRDLRHGRNLFYVVFPNLSRSEGL